MLPLLSGSVSKLGEGIKVSGLGVTGYKNTGLSFLKSGAKIIVKPTLVFHRE